MELLFCVNESEAFKPFSSFSLPQPHPPTCCQKKSQELKLSASSGSIWKTQSKIQREKTYMLRAKDIVLYFILKATL